MQQGHPTAGSGTKRNRSRTPSSLGCNSRSMWSNVIQCDPMGPIDEPNDLKGQWDVLRFDKNVEREMPCGHQKLWTATARWCSLCFAKAADSMLTCSTLLNILEKQRNLQPSKSDYIHQICLTLYQSATKEQWESVWCLRLLKVVNFGSPTT